MKQTIEIEPCIHFDMGTMRRRESCPNVKECCDDEKEDKQGNTCSDRLMDCIYGGNCLHYDSGEQP